MTRQEMKKRQKMRHLQERVEVIALMSVALMIVILSVSGIKNHMEEKKYLKVLNSYDKYYTSITIESGDTVTSMFYDLCERYPDTKNYQLDDFVDEVRQMNHLDWDCTIKSGRPIFLPYLNGEKELEE